MVVVVQNFRNTDGKYITFAWDLVNKIEKCGKLHFKAVDRSIKFDWINSYNDYKRKFGIISLM